MLYETFSEVLYFPPMNVRDWMNQADDEERERVALEAGTTVAYLWQLAGQHRAPSPGLCKRLENATGGRIPRYILRPDIWTEPDNVANA